MTVRIAEGRGLSRCKRNAASIVAGQCFKGDSARTRADAPQAGLMQRRLNRTAVGDGRRSGTARSGSLVRGQLGPSPAYSGSILDLSVSGESGRPCRISGGWHPSPLATKRAAHPPWPLGRAFRLGQRWAEASGRASQLSSVSEPRRGIHQARNVAKVISQAIHQSKPVS
jgi:hypothetical protein